MFYVFCPLSSVLDSNVDMLSFNPSGSVFSKRWYLPLFASVGLCMRESLRACLHHCVAHIKCKKQLWSVSLSPHPSYNFILVRLILRDANCVMALCGHLLMYTALQEYSHPWSFSHFVTDKGDGALMDIVCLVITFSRLMFRQSGELETQVKGIKLFFKQQPSKQEICSLKMSKGKILCHSVGLQWEVSKCS